MSDLDKKLEEILDVVSAFSSDHGFYPHEGKTMPAAQNVSEALAQIKQSLIDDGWIRIDPDTRLEVEVTEKGREFLEQ